MKLFISFIFTLATFNANAVDYTSLTLDNGLKAYLIEDHRQPIAIPMVWYNVGSADEVVGKSGLAHLHEHLMFKGTKTIAPQQFSKIIAKLGGVDNASTSFDYTNYYQMINVKNVDKALAMEADRMANLTFSEKDFQTEREVVIQERIQRIDNSPFGKFYEKVMTALYDVLPYKIITTGTAEDLKNLKRQDSLDWYKKYYTPNNAIVLIVGDLTPDQFKKLIADKFAHIQKREFSLNTLPIEPLYTKERNIVVNDKQIKSPTYYRVSRAPSLFSGLAGEPLIKKDVFTLLLLSDLLAGNQSSYLYEKLVTDLKLVNDISVDYSPISKAETTFDFSIQAKDGSEEEKIEQALTKLIADFSNDFDSEEKLAISKTKFKSSQIYMRDDAMSFARSVGKLLSAGGSIEDYNAIFENIDDVSVSDVKAAAKKYLLGKQNLHAWLKGK